MGKIDRVDRLHDGEGPTRFVVYDYKGGEGAPPKAIEEGTDLQMPFYALGAAKAVFGNEAYRRNVRAGRTTSTGGRRS